MENIKIAKKLVAVMNECSHVIKNGVNEYYHYKYATAEDVLQKVNESLTKNKIASIVVPSIESIADVTNLKGNTEHLATVSVKICLIDSDSGEYVELYGIGSGQDAGDKAVMKAQTAAIKYAYMMSLCIATGDDPEADSRTDESRGIEQPKKAAASKKNDMRNTAVKGNSQSAKEQVYQHELCTGCGVEISDKVMQYSMSKYGHPLCMDCQKRANKAA